MMLWNNTVNNPVSDVLLNDMFRGIFIGNEDQFFIGNEDQYICRYIRIWT